MTASIFNWKKEKKDEKEPASSPQPSQQGGEEKTDSKQKEKKAKHSASVSGAKKKSSNQLKIAEDLSWVIINPRITEKSAFITGVRGYTFNVDPRANKAQIKKAIKHIYGVDPVKITTTTRKSRKVIKRGRRVHQVGSKKAVAFLKKGDKIEFV